MTIRRAQSRIDAFATTGIGNASSSNSMVQMIMMLVVVIIFSVVDRLCVFVEVIPVTVSSDKSIKTCPTGAFSYVAAFGPLVPTSNPRMRVTSGCEKFESDRVRRISCIVTLLGRKFNSFEALSGDIEQPESVAATSHAGSSSSLVYIVTMEHDTKRLDSVVAAAVLSSTSASVSRSFCSTLISDGLVTVNGKTETRKSYKVTVGMSLDIQLGSLTSSIFANAVDGDTIENMIVAQDIPLSILYEDECMIVLNKAAGMVVHPAVGNRDGTLVNALAYYLTYHSRCGAGEFFIPTSAQKHDDIEKIMERPSFPAAFAVSEDDQMDDPAFEHDCPSPTVINKELASSLVSLRPGIVHRLDKGTTGVLIVAKTRAALAALAIQFGGSHGVDEEEHSRAEKTYLAITVGNPGQRVVIDRPIGRHPIYRQRMRVVPDASQNNHRRTSKSTAVTGSNVSLVHKGRRALSFVDTIAFDGKLAFVKVRIETGRTHQIRVHLQDRHTPVYGDDVYGISDWNKRLNKTYGISRPMLHSFRLKVRHPISGETMTFQAPLPDDMRKIIKTIYPQGDDENPDLFSSDKKNPI
jgi:23S rRNA pseudouridine1911/1915/1917 synthase